MHPIVECISQTVFVTRLRAVLALFTLALLVMFGSPAEAGCRWDGTAPACSGSCNANEIQKTRESGAIFGSFVAEGTPDFGEACFTGSKALCCTRTPEKIDEGAVSTVISGCVIAGVFHPEIAESDCLEAQTVGCIRRLLTDQQYVNCLKANGRRPGVIMHSGKPKKPKGDAIATDAEIKNEHEDEMKVTGRTEQECIGSNQNCEVRRKVRFGTLALTGIIAKECTPYFQQCMANAAQARAAKVQPSEDGGNGGGGGGQSLATVTQSVDVYDSPGGDGQKIGNLRKGAKVSRVSDCADDWCHIAGPRVPNGDGYVYNGDDYRSLKF